MEVRRLASVPRPALVVSLVQALSSLGFGSACTTLAAGRKATTDGSVLVTQSDDGEGNPDARLCYIPARDHAAGSRRPIYWDTEDYPRFVGQDRGSCYLPQPGQTPYEPIGYIEQVNHTYAYFEAKYGLLNEHGLGMGESTCSGIFGTDAAGHGGKALLSIDSLTRIAMERTKKAREAVKLMGSLAEQHGFYGAGSFEGSAESLMVGDAEEAFIFHILPDPTGTSAIWAAQRIPDDHVTVVANMFVIREINFEDPQSFLFSESVRSVAQAKGWWAPGKPLDFTATYSDGEYAHKFYSGRRVWGAYRRFGLNSLPDDYADLRVDAVYPVTAKPPRPVGVRDMFAVHRDFYEGTKYDMTRGLASGPWGDPDRYAVTSNATGNWERSIGLFRTAETHVVQARDHGVGSVLWYGPHAASTTCFMPLSAAATAVPAQYTVGDPVVLSRESAYWAHKYVANIVKLKYSYAMRRVHDAQKVYELAGEDLIASLDAIKSPKAKFLNTAFANHASRIMRSFWSIPDEIVQAYADGWDNGKASLGYPDWWLEAVGYQNGPPPPPPPRPRAPPGPCDDAAVRACVGRCGADGFARCAAACVASCAAVEATVVV